MRSLAASAALLLCALPLLSAAEGYSGASSCVPCHPAEATAQRASHHARALLPMKGSSLERRLLEAAQSPDGSVHYSEGEAGVLAQTKTGESALLQWAFGAGAQGRTAVGSLQTPDDAALLEHRYSFYQRRGGLALTFGHPARQTTEAGGLGIRQDERTVGRCFSCHSTVQASSKPEPLEPGVQCERCHGPGAAHIEAAHAQRPGSEIRRAVVNPGRLPPRALVEVCGACHRLPTADSGDEPELEDPVSVRFAPVGLLASQCFRQSKTLSCLTCHNPHEDARPASDGHYTDRCLSCHTSLATVKNCRRAEKANCISCHMQKASLGPDLVFTDHRIRVYR